MWLEEQKEVKNEEDRYEGEKEEEEKGVVVVICSGGDNIMIMVLGCGFE